MKKNENFTIAQNCLIKAIQEFYLLDYELLNYKTEETSVCERSMAFRIGIYTERLVRMVPEISELNVDMEYNRNFDHTKGMYKKTLENIKEKIADTYPDLIIHRRKSNVDNFLVIEFKKGKAKTEQKNYDFMKLQYFTSPENEYKYKVGFYIEIYKNFSKVVVYSEGKRKSHLDFVISKRID